jgi:hypothetical protein
MECHDHPGGVKKTPGVLELPRSIMKAPGVLELPQGHHKSPRGAKIALGAS